MHEYDMNATDASTSFCFKSSSKKKEEKREIFKNRKLRFSKLVEDTKTMRFLDISGLS